MASTSGESVKASGFNCQAARISTADATSVNTQAKPSESWPVGSSRCAVRGLRAS
jgi:hypothetical protein